MTDKDKINKLMQYRIRQADESLEEMGLLKETGHIRGALNRAYYAMFYALQALILQNKIKISKHSGVISFFDKEYVKTGIFEIGIQNGCIDFSICGKTQTMVICLNRPLNSVNKLQTKPWNLSNA